MTASVADGASPPHGFAGPLSHTRRWHAGVVQEAAPAGVLDLGPGYIEPALLPVDLLRDAYAGALEEYGAAALGYGHDPGADPLRAELAARAAAAGGHPCGPDQVVLTSGTSQALYLLATSFAAPGDTVLAEELCYDLGQRIFRDCGLRVRTVATDGSGMLPDALDHALAAVRREGGRTAFLYLTPTHHNPLGRTVPTERRRRLVEVAARHDTLILEDDAYAELALTDGWTPPPSLAALAGYRGVVRLCSFSKTLGPGLRLGWLLADAEVAARLSGHGLFVSGGSLNHTTSLAVGHLLATGAYDRHLDAFRTRLRARRDALVDTLRAALGDRVRLRTPEGGFFLWLESMAGPTEEALLDRAAAAHVRVAAGSRFGTTQGPSVRLAFSFNPPAALERAARRLAAAWTGTAPTPQIGEST
ncbi:enduracididine biosynthesis enzyme MppQ [Streptomyces paromomycinus]|uniref:GntR family transcriptional regulator n=1 Tax=Streptomyces paromomycinus TaxID=92743 RepID=A0A401VYV2_STREY|nr:enduracididine biosynthesis enzyme MppQ [Streptomyces paromomycinus]GCD42232.1 GntR family transcriptional regulator [Streptomyces paromomycinus]